MEKVMQYDGVAELRSDNDSLEIRLAGDVSGLLTRFRFSEGQEVRIRISDERLEIRPRRTTDDIQEGLQTASVQVKEVSHDLRTLRSHLPEDQGDADTAASSLEEHLGAAIDCLLVDLLDPAVARLENAARITPEEIRSS
jgi:hypothetical protein